MLKYTALVLKLTETVDNNISTKPLACTWRWRWHALAATGYLPALFRHNDLVLSFRTQHYVCYIMRKNAKLEVAILKFA